MGCIYCGTEEDLSKSDIIPDALTNAKIINPNVCRVNHNNKFSDMFESEIINKLAIITNELDIKSSKSSHYASYNASFTVDDTEYRTKMSNDTEIFNKKVIPSSDGKNLIGPIAMIRNIKGANDTNVTEIDINQREIEKKFNIEFAVFFEQPMHRLAAKIAFEWYCLNNNVSKKLSAFDPIIDFITTGCEDDPVSIVGNENVYNFLNLMTDFGNHTLISYVDEDGSVNILVSLFGIAIYNVKVCNSIPEECHHNILFLTISLDGTKQSFKYCSLDDIGIELQNQIQQTEMPGVKAIISTDTTLKYKMMYYNNLISKKELLCTTETSEQLLSVILKQIDRVMNTSALTVRGMKRFVKEHKEIIDKGVVLNPYGTNKKDIFLYYVVFICGIPENQIHCFKEVTSFVQKLFQNDEIAITDEIFEGLKKEMEANDHYATIIKQGAKVIEEMEY